MLTVRRLHLLHRWKFAAGVALTPLMSGHDVVTWGTEGITITVFFSAPAHIGPVMTLQVIRAVAEYTAVVIAGKDPLAQLMPIGTVEMLLIRHGLATVLLACEVIIQGTAQDFGEA